MSIAQGALIAELQVKVRELEERLRALEEQKAQEPPKRGPGRPPKGD